MAALLERLKTTRELQQKTKEVLDEATAAPVSIPREGGKDAITLVKRELWQKAFNALDRLRDAVAILEFAFAVTRGEDPQAYPHEFAWLRVFSREDIADFAEEYLDILHAAVSGMRSWEDVDVVLEQWHRSAAALGNDDLMKRFHEARKILDGGNEK